MAQATLARPVTIFECHIMYVPSHSGKAMQFPYLSYYILKCQNGSSHSGTASYYN